MSGPSVARRVRVRARVPRGSSAGAIDGQADARARSGDAATASSAACGASIGIGVAPPAPARPSPARSRRRGRRRQPPPGRGRGRARARAAFGEAVGPPRFRRLRQRHQQRRFAEGEPARLLAEIGERGGANAFDIAAIGRQLEIEREHLVLAEARSISMARTIWRSFAANDRVAARLQQPRHLHGEGRAAGHDVAGADELAAARSSASGSTP